MQHIKQIVRENEKRVEDNLTFAYEKYRAVFASGPDFASWKKIEAITMDVLANGKSLVTAISSFELDMKLFHETRERVSQTGVRSVELSTANGAVLASQGIGPIMNVDDRIVGSKSALIAKIEDYNRQIKRYREDTYYKWPKPPEFVSL